MMMFELREQACQGDKHQVMTVRCGSKVVAREN